MQRQLISLLVKLTLLIQVALVHTSPQGQQYMYLNPSLYKHPLADAHMNQPNSHLVQHTQEIQDNRAQHYGGDGPPIVLIYPTEREPIVVHDEGSQKPPLQILGNLRPQWPVFAANAPPQGQTPNPFWPGPFAQPGPIRQWIGDVGNWLNPTRTMTVFYPTITTSSVVVPHFVTVTASCAN